jgi:hypothetical protein
MVFLAQLFNDAGDVFFLFGRTPVTRRQFGMHLIEHGT